MGGSDFMITDCAVPLLPSERPASLRVLAQDAPRCRGPCQVACKWRTQWGTVAGGMAGVAGAARPGESGGVGWARYWSWTGLLVCAFEWHPARRCHRYFEPGTWQDSARPLGQQVSDRWQHLPAAVLGKRWLGPGMR